MNPVDIIILVIVILIVSTIIYFRFIKNRGKSGCDSCSATSKYETNKLRAYYDKVKDKD